MQRRQFVKWVIAIGILGFCGCAGASMASPETTIVGSTPGDSLIKPMLGIEPETPVDFIRWHLVLRDGQQSFVLSVRYGVGKPNTRDFEGGGYERIFEGTYDVTKEGSSEILTLRSSKMSQPVLLLKLSDDLFHVLTPDKRLMVSAGGWSYTLSKQGPSSSRSRPLAHFESLTTAAPQMVFVGRTPCQEIAREYNWPLVEDCLKLKWKLTLFRNPKTGRPTTYNLQRTLHRAEPIKGSWTVTKGTKADPMAIVYRLDPEKPESSLSFLVGDENVLFFLDKEGRLFGGNEDFSYTLNRRNE